MVADVLLLMVMFVLLLVLTTMMITKMLTIAPNNVFGKVWQPHVGCNQGDGKL